MSRLKVYNLATGQWEYVNFPLHRHGPQSSGSGVNTVSGHGSATISANSFDYEVWGRIVLYRASVTFSSVGTGSTGVAILTGCPQPGVTFTATGDRGGTGVARLLARGAVSGGFLNLLNLAVHGTPTSLIGTDIAAGSTYAFSGAYWGNTDGTTSDPILV